MPIQHALERRSTLLAGRIKQRVAALSQSFLAAQGRAPYKDPLSEAEALEWWYKNRYTALGAKALETLQPDAIANLDTALTHYAQQKEMLGLPIVTEPPPPKTDGGSIPNA